MQKPTIGRIVHFTVDNSHAMGPGDPLAAPTRTLAAIITQVSEDPNHMDVHLTAFSRDGATTHDFVSYSEAPRVGCWSWPPRE